MGPPFMETPIFVDMWCTSKRRWSSAFSDWRFCNPACSSPSLDWETWRQFLRNRSTSSNKPKKELHYCFYHATFCSPTSKLSDENSQHDTQRFTYAIKKSQGVPSSIFVNFQFESPSNESGSHMWDGMGHHTPQEIWGQNNAWRPSTHQTYGRAKDPRVVCMEVGENHLVYPLDSNNSNTTCRFLMIFVWCVWWFFLLPCGRTPPPGSGYVRITSKSWIFPCAASSSSSKRLWTSRAFWSSDKASWWNGDGLVSFDAWNILEEKTWKTNNMGIVSCITYVRIARYHHMPLKKRWTWWRVGNNLKTPSIAFTCLEESVLEGQNQCHHVSPVEALSLSAVLHGFTAFLCICLFCGHPIV